MNRLRRYHLNQSKTFKPISYPFQMFRFSHQKSVILVAYMVVLIYITQSRGSKSVPKTKFNYASHKYLKRGHNSHKKSLKIHAFSPLSSYIKILYKTYLTSELTNYHHAPHLKFLDPVFLFESISTPSTENRSFNNQHLIMLEALDSAQCDS